MHSPSKVFLKRCPLKNLLHLHWVLISPYLDRRFLQQQQQQQHTAMLTRMVPPSTARVMIRASKFTKLHKQILNLHLTEQIHQTRKHRKKHCKHNTWNTQYNICILGSNTINASWKISVSILCQYETELTCQWCHMLTSTNSNVVILKIHTLSFPVKTTIQWWLVTQ